jgi:hypothetical protein
VNNKVLVLVYVPFLEEEYDILLPINKKIGTVKKIIIDTIFELSGLENGRSDNFGLYNKENGQNYDNNLTVKDSNIINGTKLLLM